MDRSSHVPGAVYKPARPDKTTETLHLWEFAPHMAQSKSMAQRRDELMDCIRDVLARELMKLGESPNEALFNACDITDQLAQYWAGSVI